MLLAHFDSEKKSQRNMTLKNFHLHCSKLVTQRIFKTCIPRGNDNYNFYEVSCIDKIIKSARFFAYFCFLSCISMSNINSQKYFLKSDDLFFFLPKMSTTLFIWFMYIPSHLSLLRPEIKHYVIFNSRVSKSPILPDITTSSQQNQNNRVISWAPEFQRLIIAVIRYFFWAKRFKKK